MKRLRDVLTWRSRLAYLAWRALKLPTLLRVTLIDGTRLSLRGTPDDDVQTAYEVFVLRVYDSPRAIDPDSVRRVIDLGANVGISCLHWARQFPGAQVIGYEPHPRHVELARAQLQLNGLDERRVRIEPFAAACSSGTARLSDAGVSSAIQRDPASEGIEVRTIDFLAAVSGTAIDILKIDIEGGEYALLGDSRFGEVAARVIVLEWHNVPGHPQGLTWCRRRLEALGYQTEAGAWNTEHNGFIWGYR
jgi:FkbM family methyltransferase